MGKFKEMCIDCQDNKEFNRCEECVVLDGSLADYLCGGYKDVELPFDDVSSNTSNYNNSDG